MSTTLRGDSNSEARRRFLWLPVIGVSTLFVVASLFLPLRARSAPSAPVKCATAMPSYVGTPLPPARRATTLDDNFGIDCNGSGTVTCTGGCLQQTMCCRQAGTFIQAVNACCARCCMNNDPDNCSSSTCCPSP